jgi:protein tyrosine/serine phosphatase
MGGVSATDGNFHSVEDGVLYRSAQLGGTAFRDRIKEYGIRTIVKLRGENSQMGWYVDELKASESLGVAHIDFAISAVRDLTDTQLDKLAAILRDAPRPILVHCQSGSDRTGLASAIFERVIAKKSASEAAYQLSFRSGHFPWLGNRTAAMDRSLARVLAREEALND